MINQVKKEVEDDDGKDEKKDSKDGDVAVEVASGRGEALPVVPRKKRKRK